ncbi:pyruvate:ferredoxin oxidoreductase and related 2-oxoacid:ferredoxin oxidoreductases alpha subunit [Ruminococcus sp. CAG:403]|nr:pyruvate:ferredoxin oxidoreductase and related 2-oxoacid:ferredoxin oxidoreductases alpha subunit [Ruminococcus sp. CAG:403]
MERSLMKGNEALAEAAIRAGCKCFFGYPITPQTELAAYMAKRMEKAGGVFLQAESEIAAVNMVLGAASTGVRAMTSSSSPGVSLKAEGISYMAGSDLPAVIINVQRGGPGLGSIQPAQSDYYQATHAMGHGDFHILVFAPCSVQEMVDTVMKAFDKADEYRIPAMILADGLLGQMMEPVTFPPARETLPDKSDWAACGHGNKRPHHIINSLYLDAPLLEKNVKERFERYAIIEEHETDAELYQCDDAELVVTAYGASARVAKSAVMTARKQGLKVGLFRPKTLWPFPKKELNQAIAHASQLLCVEMSMGQMIDDVRLAINCSRPVAFFGRTGGVIPTPAEVLAEIKKLMGGEA